jgi:hypothetical protein
VFPGRTVAVITGREGQLMDAVVSRVPAGYIVPAGPIDDERVDRAHLIMQSHLRDAVDVRRCVCGEVFPCLARREARAVLVVTGRLVLAGSG